MKKALLAAICFFAWTAPTRAQDTYEKILDEMVPAFGKLADTLGTIKDKKTSDEAKPKLKEIAKQMGELKARADKLGEPQGDKKTDLEKKYKPKMEEHTKKLSTEMIRIATQVEGGMDIVKEISELLAPLGKKK